MNESHTSPRKSSHLFFPVLALFAAAVVPLSLQAMSSSRPWLLAVAAFALDLLSRSHWPAPEHLLVAAVLLFAWLTETAYLDRGGG